MCACYQNTLKLSSGFFWPYHLIVGCMTLEYLSDLNLLVSQVRWQAKLPDRPNKVYNESVLGLLALIERQSMLRI